MVVAGVIGPEEDEGVVVVVVVVLMVEVVLVVVMDWDDFMEGVGVDEESAETGVVAVCAVDAEVEGLGEMTPLPGDVDDDAVGLL